MRYRTDIRCSECSKTPAERRDQVSEQAVGYTCWACLMGYKPETALSAYKPLGATTGLPEGKEAGSSEEPQSSPMIPATSNTVFRHGRAGKGGRPTVPELQRRLKVRERNRAYRQRQTSQAA